MNRRVRFEQFARVDLWESIDWYNKEDPGLGLGWQFAEEMTAELERIAANPWHFRLVRRRGQIRKAVLVTRFEFTVYFAATEEELIVYSLFHPNRNPSLLKKRGII